jgi:hypothetical protein
MESKELAVTRDEDALRMLAEVQAANADMAERAKAPVWYHPALGLLLGGLAAIQAAPLIWQGLYFVVYLVGLGLLVKAYIRKTGMWIPGYRAGRTRIVAVSLVIVCVGLTAFSGWLFHLKHMAAAPSAASSGRRPIAATCAMVASRERAAGPGDPRP